MLIDKLEREQSVDISESYIVCAPAGSGKTACLIQRLLNAQASIEDPREILCITYTNKAAAEMKERNLLWLSRASEGYVAKAEFEVNTLQAAKKAMDNFDRLGLNPIHDPSILAITTIDGLCGQIARGAPHLSGVNSDTKVTTDATAHYQHIANVVASKLHSYQDSDIEELIDFLADGPAGLKEIISESLASRSVWRHATATESLSKLVHSSLEQYWERNLKSLEGQIAEIMDYTGRRFATPLTQTAVKDAIGVFLKNDGTARKSFTKREGFPAVKEVVTPEAATRLNSMKALAKEVGQALELHQEYVQYLLKHLSSNVDDDLCVRLSYALHKTLCIASDELNAYLKEINVADHPHISECAMELLNQGNSITELLGHEIKHLCIDEYQDVDPSQLRLTEALTKNLGNNGTLFVVGDYMQSIYRFKNADVSIFMKALKDGIGEHSLKRLDLRTNFRSDKAVVDWNNQLYDRVFNQPASLFEIDSFNYNPSSSTNDRTKKKIRVHRVKYSGDQSLDEAQTVCSLLKSASPNESIGILCRSKKPLATLQQTLVDNEIKHTAVGLRTLLSDPGVIAFSALTTVCANPHNELAWYELLLSRPIELDPGTLSRVSRKSGILRDLARLLKDDISQPCLREMAVDYLGVLKGPLSVIDSALTLWNLHFKDAYPESTDMIITAYKALAALTNEHPRPSASAIEQSLSNITVDVTTDPRIQLMTIHASKGLEFDRVILIAANRNTLQPLSQKAVTFRHDGNYKFVLNHPELTSDTLGFAKHQHRCFDWSEISRLLYVGTTRCISEMDIIHSTKDGKGVNAKNSFSSILEFASMLTPAD